MPADKQTTTGVTTPAVNERIQRGQVLMRWQFPEYEKPDRGIWWYLFITVFLGGLLIWALSDANVLFALIVVLFAFILFTHHRGEPMILDFVLYERGVLLANTFYLFTELESFTLIYNPPEVKKLYLTPKNAMLRREIPIPLYDNDPLAVRAILAPAVHEDLEKDDESGGEIVARLLKW